MTLTDEVKRMIQSALENMEVTSASPNKTNRLIQVNNIETPDLDAFVSGGSDDEAIKNTKRTDNVIKKVEGWDKGKVGELNRFTSTQMGNLRGFVDNPVQFIMASVFRKLAKGAGIIAFALIIFEAVKWIISELLKPGRLLDLRFKRVIGEELIAFRQREDQQKIKQGFTGIIITTQPRLRGGAAQTQNTFNLVRTGEIKDLNIGQAEPSQMMIASSGLSMSKNNGKKTGGRRY